MVYFGHSTNSIYTNKRCQLECNRSVPNHSSMEKRRLGRIIFGTVVRLREELVPEYTNMKIKHIKMKTGERLPMLLDDNAVPDFWVTLYICNLLRSRAQNTIE